MSDAEIEHFYPETKQHWRAWLEKNHQVKDAVWLIQYKKNAGKPSVAWSDAVDEALCYGWIDSKVLTIDAFSFKQYFCKRKPKSTWSKVNKDKLEKLIATNKMTDSGLACVAIAKQNGSWTILDTVEDLIIPEDLEAAFAQYPKAKDAFLAQSKSQKKLQLSLLVFAKTTVTRQKRIAEILELLARK